MQFLCDAFISHGSALSPLILVLIAKYFIKEYDSCADEWLYGDDRTPRPKQLVGGSGPGKLQIEMGKIFGYWTQSRSVI